MDTASSRKMEDEKKEPVKLEEKLNRLEKEFGLPRVLIKTVLCRSDIEGDLNKAMQQLKEFKVSATLQDRPRADRCSVSCFYKNPYKPYIF